jgi:hypothetical protein
MTMNDGETKSSLRHHVGPERKPASEPQFLSPAERREKGKDLRDAVPREATPGGYGRRTGGIPSTS